MSFAKPEVRICISLATVRVNGCLIICQGQTSDHDALKIFATAPCNLSVGRGGRPYRAVRPSYKTHFASPLRTPKRNCCVKKIETFWSHYLYIRRNRFVPFQNVRTTLGAHFDFYSMCTGGFFPVVMRTRRGSDYSSPSCVEIKAEKSCVSTPPTMGFW
jgi:hypothetical protein